MSFVEDYAAGEMTVAEIAAKYSMTRSQLVKTVRAMGLKRSKRCYRPNKPGFIHCWITKENFNVTRVVPVLDNLILNQGD